MNKYGYRTPGYGTSWGTNFAGGAGRWSKVFSKEMYKGESKVNQLTIV